MAVILDTSPVINLNRAGLLALVFNELECIILPEVYAEAVDTGRYFGYPDADEIAAIINPPVAPPTRILPEVERFGDGEAAVFSKYIERQSRVGLGEDVIVSDDRQFLNHLRRRNARSGRSINYLNTASFIADLGATDTLPKSQARDSLERIRPRMRAIDYQAALLRLEL